MGNDIWTVESDPFDALSVFKKGNIRLYYLQAVIRLGHALEEENAFKLETEKEAGHKKFLPTIIFSELHKEKTDDQMTVRLVCYRDRDIFIKALEQEKELEA